MVEANPTNAADQSGTAAVNTKDPTRNLIISSNNFIHMNEGNIKTFYKISSCIGRGKCKPTKVISPSPKLSQVIRDPDLPSRPLETIFKQSRLIWVTSTLYS